MSTNTKEKFHFPCFQTCTRKRDQIEGCAIIADVQNVILSEPIEILISEHKPLLDSFSTIIGHLEKLKISKTNTHKQNSIEDIEQLLLTFIKSIVRHSTKEDNLVLVKMDNYMDISIGPVAVIENEHTIVDKLLSMMLEDVQNIKNSNFIEFENIEDVIEDAKNTLEYLEDHFMKEEIVLFPLAEKLLSNEDKAYILAQLK